MEKKPHYSLLIFRTTILKEVRIRHISNRPGSTFFLPDTEGADIHQCVAPTGGEEIVRKHFPNSFFQTNLLNLLKSKEITNLVICGMMMHMCVDATVRAAKDLKFKERTVKATDVQIAFLSALAPFYSTVVSTEEYINTDSRKVV